MRFSMIDNESDAYKILKKERQGCTVGVIYRGRVVVNEDPSGTGRIKAWIPNLYPTLNPYDENNNRIEENIQQLPWALPCFSSASYNAGSFIIPQIGDVVWLAFERNDIFRPVYIGFMYTTGSSYNVEVGSGYAPANENYVPNEGISPNHYIVMKTPKGSGLWMNDEDSTAHFYSANGGQLDLNNDRTTISYANGGSISSQEGGVYLVTPLEGKILLTDSNEEYEDSKILLELENTKISIVKDKNITLELDDKKIIIDKEEDLIKIHYNDEVSINLGDNSILARVPGASIEMSDSNLSIKASDTITIDAPNVNISGED